MSTDDEGQKPTQVSRVGRFEAANLYLTAALMCLSGPAMLGAALFADADTLVIGIVFTVVFPLLGLGLWFHTTAELEYNRRLDAVGVAAVAEVTCLTDFDDGESIGVVIGLRISGPGFETFETTCKRSRHPALRVGLRLAATVDPSDRLFRVAL